MTEERPATREEIEAEWSGIRIPSLRAKLRAFIDQIGPDDVPTYRRWNSIRPLSGTAGAGYLCKKPDGAEVWCSLMFVMS